MPLALAAHGRLADRSDIIQHPQAATISCDNQVVVLDLEVVDRHGRETELQRLPAAAIIHGYHHTGLGAQVENAGFLRILTNHKGGAVGLEVSIDAGPGLAII